MRLKVHSCHLYNVAEDQGRSSSSTCWSRKVSRPRPSRTLVVMRQLSNGMNEDRGVAVISSPKYPALGIRAMWGVINRGDLWLLEIVSKVSK
jgi:hypothetical protein